MICTEESAGLYEAPVKKIIGTRTQPETIAHNLYDVLRAFDEEAVDCIFSESFDDSPLSGAIMNRLTKAAGHRIIECRELGDGQGKKGFICLYGQYLSQQHGGGSI